MKRIVNVRLPVVTACALVLGEATAYTFRYFHIDLLFISAVAVVAAVFFIVFIMLKRKRAVIYTAVALLAFTVGFTECILRFNFYDLREIDADTVYYITGKVVEKGVSGTRDYVILNGATADGQKLGGKLIVYLSGSYGDFCDTGYKIEFSSKITSLDLFTYGKFNRFAEENVKFSCTVAEGVTSRYAFSLFGSIRSAIRSSLFENLDKNTAAVCYGMLVGDTHAVEEETLSAFRYGGIAHIFAVSGLHIGIVYGLINTICKKLRANKFLNAAICTLFILFYSAVCGFTVSSVRAVITCAVSMATRLMHVKRDSLNTLSFAVILILLINPLSLFSVGFQLSVCAVGGIAVFSKNIVKYSSKIKIPEFISSKYAVTAGAQLGTLPILAATFGYISGTGLLLNLVFVPILSFAFVIIFAATFICLIIPAAAVIMPSAVVILEAVISFVVDFGLEKSIISGFGAGGFAIVYFTGILSVSDKINLRALPRAVGLTATCCALVIFVLLKAYSPFEGHEITVSGSYYGGSVLIKSQNARILVITENASPYTVKNSLNENYAAQPDAIILLCNQEYTTKYGYDYDFECKDVYLSNLLFPAQPDSRLNFHYEHRFELYGVAFEFTDTHSLAFVCDGVSVAVCADENMRIKSCDLLISQKLNYDTENHSTIVDADKTVYFSQKGYAYNVAEYGEMKFKTKDGRLSFARPPVKR